MSLLNCCIKVTPLSAELFKTLKCFSFFFFFHFNKIIMLIPWADRKREKFQRKSKCVKEKLDKSQSSILFSGNFSLISFSSFSFLRFSTIFSFIRFGTSEPKKDNAMRWSLRYQGWPKSFCMAAFAALEPSVFNALRSCRSSLGAEMASLVWNQYLL